MEQNWFGMWQTAVSRFTSRPSYLFHLLKRNAPVKSADLVITLLALPSFRSRSSPSSSPGRAALGVPSLYWRSNLTQPLATEPVGLVVPSARS